ncbi:hypothetical protein J4E83_005577 [Alternaria metachromatica]|uniref:uncharacterized protein n=1 Tax=Alternaria metachromatica TaxID=283354 RepID=UPI0020C303BB|nr:uncharacterized protein J4E83_005577 [Alternaria metachromatica]KAI4619722.1 hypothetical protein J4E83_005577 [Alternaria metachromatica]
MSGVVMARTKQEDSTFREVLDELEALRVENERLRHGTSETFVPSQPAVLAYTGKVFYKVGQTLYLDEPRWEPAEGSGVVLLANNPIRKIEYYLDQHPEIAFAIYKEYKQTPPSDRSKIETKDGVYRSPTPAHEFLSIIADDMLDAVEELVQQIPKFGDYFPYFDPEGQILAPYLFMYYSAPFIPEILPDLDTPSQNLIRQLQSAIEKSYGYEYDSAKLQAEKGRVSRKHLKYLFQPGDVLVRNGTGGYVPQACIATDWIERPETTLEDSQYEESDYIQRKRIPRYGPLANSESSRKLTTYSWEVPMWYWLFDGAFAKQESRIEITMSLGYEEETVAIRDLNVYPLRYASEDMRLLLEKRGKTFWSLRNRHFVSYIRSKEDELYNVRVQSPKLHGALHELTRYTKIEERYMVDTKAYKMLFPHSDIAKLHCEDELGIAAMARDQPPEDGDALLVMPAKIMAHNLQEKHWRELFVDRITDVVWNKQAFKDLVAEPETKELVQALVMKQLNAKKSTDFVAGKGNGLIMLLHGAPGTGKTFTAEGVAEFAEKPLLRVTCGDVGTDAEVVDRRLRATFQLGKMWDCVVLLDEADVFLEERDMKDLKRNALVSVFLRALEYYDGILILTSNRVGTFDEAFKSRIQLALHYDNLGLVQRKKIWRNFIARMKTLDESSDDDLEDILDHIDDLSKEPMNGREIRNAITIARQLAQFREQPFQYSHLKHAINVGNRFSKYLKDLRMNYTDDMIKQDSGIRFSYTAAPAGIE